MFYLVSAKKWTSTMEARNYIHFKENHIKLMILRFSKEFLGENTYSFKTRNKIINISKYLNNLVIC